MKKELRVIIDSNILVRILKGSQNLDVIFTAFKEDKFRVVICKEQFAELSDVLHRPHLKIESALVKELFKLLNQKAVRVKLPPPHLEVCRDPKDNFILELALAGKADYIVTEDKDLLVCHPFHKTQIVLPALFWMQLRKRERGAA